MYRIVLASGCGLVILASLGAYAGVLNVGNPTVEDNLYTVPILLNSGPDSVAALDFRLQYDPAVFRPVSAMAGLAAQQANKIVTANMPVEGEYIVVMMGLNQTTLETGEVARVFFERLTSPDAGQSRIEIIEPTLATLEGTEIPVSANGLTVRFAGRDLENDSDASKERPAESESPATGNDPSGGQLPDGSAGDTVTRESGDWMAGFFDDPEAVRDRIAAKQAAAPDELEGGAAAQVQWPVAMPPPDESGAVSSGTDGNAKTTADENDGVGNASGAQAPGETILREASSGPVTIELSGERGSEDAADAPASPAADTKAPRVPSRIVWLMVAVAAGIALVLLGLTKLRK